MDSFFYGSEWEDIDGEMVWWREGIEGERKKVYT